MIVEQIKSTTTLTPPARLDQQSGDRRRKLVLWLQDTIKDSSGSKWMETGVLTPACENIDYKK